MGKAIRVLLIADNPGEVKIIKRELEKSPHRFSLDIVDGGLQGLDKVHGNSYDLVLLDYNLDGLDVLRQIKKEQPALPVVMLTPRGQQRVGLQAIRDGALDYLPKGEVSFRCLSRSVLDYLERQRLLNEKMQLMQRLHRSEEKYRTLFQYAGNAVVVIEEDKTLSLVNKRFEELSGYSKDEIEGKMTFVDFLPEYEKERMVGYHVERRKEAREVPTHYEFDFKQRDGELRRIDLHVQVIPGTKQSIAALNDITERKRAEEVLRESEERFSKAFHANPTAIAIVMPTGPILDVNESFLRVTGYSRKEVIGHTSVELGLVSRDTRAKIYQTLSEQGAIRDLEMDVRAKSGEMRTVLLSLEAIELGGEQRILSMFHDISERKQAEMEIKQQVEHLNVLHRISSYISQNLDSKEIVNHIASAVVEELGFDMAYITSYSEADKALRIAALQPINRTMKRVLKLLKIDPARYLFPLAPENNPFFKRMLSGESITTISHRWAELVRPNIPEALADTVQATLRVKTMMHVSLWNKDRFMGSILAATRKESIPKDKQRLVEAIAYQASVAISNAQLYESTKDQLQQQERENRKKEALYRLRDKVLEMKQSSEIGEVLVEMEKQLRGFGISFNDCSMHIFHPQENVTECYCIRRGKLCTVTWKMVPGSPNLEAWQKKRVVYRQDLDENDFYQEKKCCSAETPIRSVVDVPFSKGSIAINSVRPYSFTPEHIQILEDFAQIISEGYARFEDFQRLEQRNRELSTLNEIAVTVSRSLDLQFILNTALDKVLEVLQLEPQAGIFLVDENQGELFLYAHRGLSPEFVQKEKRVKIGECLCGLAAQFGELIISENSHQDKRHTRRRDAPPHAHIIIPLKSSEKIVGVMFFYLRRAHSPTLSDIELLTAMGGQIGIAVDNARLYDVTKKSEEKIRAEKEKLLNILNTMQDGAYILAPDRTIRFLNKSMVKIFGEGVGSPCHKYLYGTDKACEFCDIDSIIRGRSKRSECTLKNGKIYELLASPYLDSDGKMCKLAILRDISKRKKMEENLRKLSETLMRRNQELERFKRVTVGRELRMIELKKKIKELEGSQKN